MILTRQKLWYLKNDIGKRPYSMVKLKESFAETKQIVALKQLLEAKNSNIVFIY